jgi:hypothetical protein
MGKLPGCVLVFGIWFISCTKGKGSICHFIDQDKFKIMSNLFRDYQLLYLLI